MSVVSVLSPEARLLLATARRSIDEEAVHALLDLEVAWPRLLRLAIRQRSLPPLWRQLEPHLDGRLPEGGYRAFDRAAAEGELYLTLLHGRLVEALDVLERAGVDVLLLKGAALAHHGYGHFRERPMGDLDLLVPPGSARSAWDLLRRKGWAWNSELYPAHRSRGLHHLPPLVDDRGTGATLEVHSAVLPPGHGFRLESRDMWAGGRELRIEGRRARTPSPIPHLLHLCVHFAWSHQLSRGAWRTFRDVEVIAGMEGFRWEGFLEAARRTGTDRCGYWTLWLARAAAGIPVPRQVLERLRPGEIPASIRDRLARHYVLNLFDPEGGCPSVGLRRLVWRIGVHPLRDDRVPWLDDLPPAAAPGAAPLPAAERPVRGWRAKVARHFGDRAAWLRYLRRVLRGARS